MVHCGSFLLFPSGKNIQHPGDIPFDFVKGCICKMMFHDITDGFVMPYGLLQNFGQRVKFRFQKQRTAIVQDLLFDGRIHIYDKGILGSMDDRQVKLMVAHGMGKLRRWVGGVNGFPILLCQFFQVGDLLIGDAVGGQECSVRFDGDPCFIQAFAFLHGHVGNNGRLSFFPFQQAVVDEFIESVSDRGAACGKFLSQQLFIQLCAGQDAKLDDILAQ